VRITTKLSTAAAQGFLSMPALREPAAAYTLGARTLDEAKVRKELANHEGIQMSSDDDRDTLSFAVELLDRMKTAMARHMETDKGTHEVARDDPQPKSAAQRRFDKGRMTFVRVDIRRNDGGGFRVKLAATNPKQIVGSAEEFARIYAQAFADNIQAIADSLADEHVPVVLQEGEGCAGVFAEARKRNDLWAAKCRHPTCPNRCAGYCSPQVRDCGLYNPDGGFCRYYD